MCESSTVTLCPAGYTYNTSTKLCETNSYKCPSGLVYDQATKLCRAGFITNPDTDDLISSNITAYG